MFTTEFDRLYAYEGNDLGFTYTKAKTTFRLWAPIAEKVTLVTYDNGDIECKCSMSSHEMQKDVKGTWVVTLEGDQNGVFYTYRIKNPGYDEAEAVDPYAKALGVNGDRSAVIDLSQTNPRGWENDVKPFFSHPVDAVIYEIHVRDLSINEDSGIINKGKYIAFTEEGTRSKTGVTTGIDHISEIGITHLQLQPAYDYALLNEKVFDKSKYNWGYDPKNYNVPEGSYATDPYMPGIRVKEFKMMVQALHAKGIRVVMDVVYNHTYENYKSIFHKVVPGYYYRMKEDGTFHNGSHCHSETASERAMMRKYIVDSVKYWVEEYHIDGFRFDLMGLHDITTMNEVRKALDEIDPTLILYGEGWDMGNHPREVRAIQDNAAKLERIGLFNDRVRDNLKGIYNDPLTHGFVDGEKGLELEVMKCVTGSIHYNDRISSYNICPAQSINYVECHDNHTLWDKLELANPGLSEDERIKMHLLANTIILTSQGVPFLHAGSDFLRTKYGVYDSVNSPDSINQLEWERKAQYIDVFNYYKALVGLRKNHPAFRMREVELIRNNIIFTNMPENVVGYVINGAANNDNWKNIFVVYNANNEDKTLEIPYASWNIVVKGKKAGEDALETLTDSKITVPALSAIVMHTENKIDYDSIRIF
ncbi:MAG: type I pullulanase [Clostridia bacterium]|nr:type I pullulanase [Clostridia bacterium]